MKKSILKTSLDHLPSSYQQDLLDIKKTILKHAPAEMIILFGSYAREDYESDTYQKGSMIYEDTSDYNILVVTEENPNDWPKTWHILENETSQCPTFVPATLINYTIGFLNEQIQRNYSFFVDIYKERVMLYDSGKHDLATPKELWPKNKIEKAQESYDHWMRQADSFFKGAKFYMDEKDADLALFLLHQATKSSYTNLLLTSGNYTSKTQDLERLKKRLMNSKAEGVIGESMKELDPKQLSNFDNLLF